MTATLGWTFLAPGCPRPTGGDIARFELVNELARTGSPVRVVHLPTAEITLRRLDDLPWFRFHDAVEHQLATDLDPDGLPDTDVVVYSTKLLWTALVPGGGDAGPRLVDTLAGGSARRWLPVAFLQGHGVFPTAIEDLAFRLPGPKVCVGGWLVRLLLDRGLPPARVVHIPNGIDHERFRVVRPIADRSPRVAMNFDPYPVKRGEVGLSALEQAGAELALPATVFGTVPVPRPLSAGLDVVFSPSQAALAEIYNGASLFLQPSRQEGFGMCAVESMACGCALVTTSNGGSDDYARDGETALVCGGEAEEMVDALRRLVQDDALRIRLAHQGARFVERFRWTTSAARLREVATAAAGQARTDPAVEVDLAALRRGLAQ